MHCIASHCIALHYSTDSNPASKALVTTRRGTGGLPFARTDLDKRGLLGAEVYLPVLDVEVVILEDLLPFLGRTAQAAPLEVVLGMDRLVRVPLHAVVDVTCVDRIPREREQL